MYLLINSLIAVLSCGFRVPKSYSDLYVIKTGALGDFLFLIPALYELTKIHKGRIVLVFSIPNSKTRQNVGNYSNGHYPYYVELFKGHLYDDVIYVKPALFTNKLMKNRGRYVIITGPGESPFRIIKKILFLRLNGVCTRIYGCIGSYYRIGKWNIGRTDFRLIDHFESNTHSLRQVYPDLTGRVKALNINDYISTDKIFNILTKYGLEKYITISIGSLKPHKIWPTVKYVELIRKLREDMTSQIILIGTESDLNLSEVITSNIRDKRIINLVGRTSLEELFVILSKSSLMIGNDGGAVHVSGIFGVDTISIAPSLEPVGSVAPYNNKSRQLYNNTRCSPCYSMEDCPLGTKACIDGISVSDVLEVIRNL